MFVWGRRHKSIQRNVQDNFVCEKCGRAGKSTVVVDYDYSHIYWLFRSAKNVQVLRVCECGASYGTDKQGQQDLFSKLGGNPIPVFDRYGAVALVLLVAGTVSFAYMSQAKRDSTGAIVSEGQVSAFDIQLGDCFDESGSSGTEEVEVSGFHALPCADPHDNEVFAIFDLDLQEFPGSDISALAFDGCLQRFETFVGREYETSALDIFAIYPTPESWRQMGDREVVCALYDLELEKLQGSMKGSGI